MILNYSKQKLSPFVLGLFIFIALSGILASIPGQTRGRSDGDEPTAGEKPTLRVPKIDTPIKVDGVLDEEAWQRALVIDANVEVEPGENIEAPVKTECLLAYGDKHFYVGWRCYDPDPSKIRARYTDRDQIFDDDWVAVIVDTFNDARRSFDYFSNPLGVQADTIEAAGGGGGSAWDAIFDTAGQITDWGYVVEMAIPFSSIRFQKTEGDQIWSFDAVRSYPRNVRHHIGAFPRERGNNCYLCQAIKIEGFSGADPGKNLEFDPTLTGLYAEARDGFPDGKFVKSDSKIDPGITVRWSITPNLTLNGTVNPDFSQIEADSAQLDINTQFALFYPEKRPFFLEGMDFFNTRINAVYTRTLADPQWGVKLSGKVGKGALGYFTVKDQVTNLLIPSAEYSVRTGLPTKTTGSVFRYRYDVGESSTVGVLATSREGTGYSNRVFGVDTALRFTPQDTIFFQVLGSKTRYPDSVVSSYGQPEGQFGGYGMDFMYFHNTRTWEYYLHYIDYSDDFRADLGFVPQVGYSFFDTGFLYKWYHNDPSHWYNRIQVWAGYELTRDQRDRRLREVYGSFVSYNGPKQSWLFATLYVGKQTYLGLPFDHNTISWNMGFVPYGDLELELGGFYGDAVDYAGARQAKRFRLTPEIELYAGKHFSLIFEHNYERLWVKEGRLYTANLSELRAVYQFNHRTFLRIILQKADYTFNEELYAFPIEPRQKDLLSQILFSYKVNPQTALYLGYSDNYLGNSQVGLTQMDRAVFFKIGYAWVL